MLVYQRVIIIVIVSSSSILCFFLWTIYMANHHEMPGSDSLYSWLRHAVGLEVHRWMDGFHKQRWIHKHIMWLKVCHKPPMPGNGLYKFIHVYTTYRHGDDRGMVYSIFLTTSWEYDKHQMVTFMAIYWDVISSTNLWIFCGIWPVHLGLFPILAMGHPSCSEARCLVDVL